MTRFILTRTDDNGTTVIGIYNKFREATQALDKNLEYESDPDCSYSIEEHEGIDTRPLKRHF